MVDKSPRLKKRIHTLVMELFKNVMGGERRGVGGGGGNVSPHRKLCADLSGFLQH